MGIGELKALLGVSTTAIKKAMVGENFEEYCRQRCGMGFRPVDVSKPGAKIPRWEFQQLDEPN